MNASELALINQWQKVMDDEKATIEYDSSITYGLYQIKTDLNTIHLDEDTGKSVYNYPSLNGKIRTLANMVKEYYNTEIVPTLFAYEFLK